MFRHNVSYLYKLQNEDLAKHIFGLKPCYCFFFVVFTDLLSSQLQQLQSFAFDLKDSCLQCISLQKHQQLASIRFFVVPSVGSVARFDSFVSFGLGRLLVVPRTLIRCLLPPVTAEGAARIL